MKIALCTIAYKEERFIGPFVNHYKYLVDHLAVLCSLEPWNGEAQSVDWTPEIAEKCGASEIYIDRWPNETEQRNDALELLRKDYDWIITLDPDEFYTVEDFAKLKMFLANAPGNVYTSQMFTYWKNGYRIDPPEPHCPVVAIRGKSNVKFTGNRGVNVWPQKLPNSIILHHLSWARTDEEVQRKLSYFSHNVDFDTDAWYESVWLGWTPEMTDFHPMNPSQYHKVIKAQIPEEIRRLFGD